MFTGPRWRIFVLLGMVTLLSCGSAAALTRLALHDGVLVLAALYPLAFMALAWYSPKLALLLTFAAAPFQSDISNGVFAKFSIAEVNLSLTCLVFLFKNLVRRRPITPGPIALPVLGYFAVCVYSSIITWRGDVAVISILQMFLYFWVAVVVFSSFADREDDLLLPLNGSVVVGAFMSIAGVATSFRFMGLNKNGLGASLSIALLVAVELWFAAEEPRRKAMLTIGMAIIAGGLTLSLSRGAWIGALAGLFVILLMRREFKLALRAAWVLIPLVAICWMALPQESKDYAVGFDSSRMNINARYKSIDFAQSEFKSSPIYGVGVGLRKEFDATNLVMVTLAETGVLGLAGLLLIHGVFFRMIWVTRRRVEPLDPRFSLLAVGGALIVCQFSHGLVDHYWSRGVVSAAWDAAGMATGVYYSVRRRGESGGLK